MNLKSINFWACLMVLILVFPNKINAEGNDSIQSIEKTFNDTPLLIRGNYAFAPFESLGPNDEMIGFDVDLMRAMMRILNYKYNMQLQDLDSCIGQASERKIDIIMGIAYNTERNNTLSFGLPICYINRKIVSRDNNVIDSKEALRNKSIAIQEAGWTRKYLDKEKLTDKIVYCKDMKECLQLLVDGDVDAVLASDCASFYEVKRNGFKNLHFADLGIRPQPYSFAVPRNNEELLFRLNEALQTLKVTGEYDMIYEKWFGVYESKSHLWIIFTVVIVAVILILIAFYFTCKYRRQDRRARRKLKESYDQLQLALNAGNISAWIYNLAEKIMFPLSENQLIHDNAFIQNFLDNIEPDDVPKVEDMIHDVAQGKTKLGKVCFQQKRIENQPEQYFETKMKLIPANDDHPVLIVGTLKNITDDVMEQRRLIEMKEKAENDNKVKSALLANISHDIRTPLGAIRGFNEILNGQDRDLLEENDREMYLKIISTNIDIVTTLVQEVLDLAKFESGTYQVNYSEVDLEDICITSIENVRNQVKEGVELKYTNHCKDMTITTDSVRLLQVLSNYLTNACKYTDKGSIELSCECLDNKMRFSVSDTGKGIRPEDAEICFDRFKMLKDSQAGTGLGLHICKLIAEILGGKVFVDTTYTKGAKFVFEFPVKK